MRLLSLIGTSVCSGVLVATLGMAGNILAREQAVQPVAQSAGGAATGQGAAGGSTTVLVPQSQVVYETVQSVECVQVPVTHMQTHYRTEYRTEAVPVTRMVPEVVNETRTVTVCVPRQQTINKPVTRV